MRIHILLSSACALALSFTALAESATVVRASQLVAEPYVDATSRGTLARESSVETLERRGGWYHVRTEDGREGWVRLSSIRLGETAAEAEGGFWASLFSFTGRSQTRTASATTGIRGLSEEEIRDAVPDDAAVARLAEFSANDDEARRFAAEIGLEPRAVKSLDDGGRQGGAK